MATGKAFVADMTISLTPLSVNGKLVPVAPSSAKKGSSLKLACPECGAEAEPIASAMVQGYTCEVSGHGPFIVGDCLKAKVNEDKTLTLVSEDAVKQAKASDLPPNYLELTVHPAQAVVRQTFPSEFSYVFYPKQVTPQFGVLLDLVAEPDLAFIGYCNLRNSEKLVRLTRWGDNLLTQCLLYPEDLYDREIVDIEYPAKLLETMVSIVEGSVAEFDPAVYTNNVKARMAEIVGGSVSAGVAAKAPKVNDADALLAAMEATLKQKEG